MSWGAGWPAAPGGWGVLGVRRAAGAGKRGLRVAHSKMARCSRVGSGSKPNARACDCVPAGPTGGAGEEAVQAPRPPPRGLAAPRLSPLAALYHPPPHFGAKLPPVPPVGTDLRQAPCLRGQCPARDTELLQWGTSPTNPAPLGLAPRTPMSKMGSPQTPSCPTLGPGLEPSFQSPGHLRITGPPCWVSSTLNWGYC